eukprot:6460357-Amphidinium_carterae.1
MPLTQLASDSQARNHTACSSRSSSKAGLAPQLWLVWLFVWLSSPAMWTGMNLAPQPAPPLQCTRAQWRRQRGTLAVLCPHRQVSISYTKPRARSPFCGQRVGEAKNPGP